MIEKMRKITFFIYHEDREKFLSRLQKVGTVHIDKISTEIDPVTSGSEIRLSRFMKELRFLNELEHGEDGGDFRLPKTASDWDKLIDGLDSDRAELARLTDRARQLEGEINRVTPWGDFDRTLAVKLQEEGVQIKLYSVTQAQFNRMDLSGLPVEIVSRDKENIYFLAMYVSGVKPAVIEAKEEKIPEQPLSDLKREYGIAMEDIRKFRGKVRSYRKFIPGLRNEIVQSRNHWIWNRTNSNLKRDAEGLVYIATGWVPVRQFAKVEAFLDKESVAYIAEEPDKKDNVPISLKNNPFAKLFEPILKIFSLPSYTELDTTPFFAPFYMLFFGLCVADVGYGIILFLAALAVLIFVKNRSFRPLAALGLFLSLSVALSGLVLDDFFGMHILELEWVPKAVKYFILFPTRADAMSLAILLGIVQIVFGFLVRIVNQVRRHGPLGALMPIGTIGLLSGSVILLVRRLAKGLTIGPLPVYQWFSSIPNGDFVSLAMIFCGLALVLFFNSMEHKMSIFVRPLLGLWELYGLLTGLPGDILSYLRLFALGLAGGLLGHAVLNIAMLLKGDSILNIVAMTLVLLVGNALNLAIGLLSAFVHSLRLTFVEFYKSVGFIGGGKAYDPFRLNQDAG